jgi:hypothetical protein
VSSLPRRRRVVSAAFALSIGIGTAAPSAKAEKILAEGDHWQVYTDGRVGAFVSYVRGDGFPQSTQYTDSTGASNILHDVKGGGWSDLSSVEQQPVGNNPNVLNQGTVESMRIRSGFIGNTLGIGARNTFGEGYKVSGYFQIWAYVESLQREKNQPNYADVRQGYAKLEAPWGNIQAGRMRGLFSRAATDTDTMYAHRYGLGFPSNIDSGGFANGQIGFGLLGSGFSSAIQYASPVFVGIQASVGIYDPIVLQGAGAWNRTKWARPEAELTFERPISDKGKFVLFGSGAIQEVFKQGYCVQDATHPDPCSEVAAGVVYGGRFEYGVFHLGLSGYYGKGVGLNYALEVNDANLDPTGVTRILDGYYGQAQLALPMGVDFFAGAGIARLFLTNADKQTVQDPRFPNDPTRQITPHSVLKDQIGINAGVVYHVTPFLHVDLDGFRAQADWFLGEQQVLNVINGGMTTDW